MSSTLGAGVGKGVGSGEERLRKLIQGKASSRLGHQVRALSRRDSQSQVAAESVLGGVVTVVDGGRTVASRKITTTFAKRFVQSNALRLASTCHANARVSVRCYATESGVPKNGEEAKKEEENDFGTIPRATSEQSVNAFRDNMKKEAGKLSMEPSELKNAIGGEKTGEKLSTQKLSTNNAGAPPKSQTPSSDVTTDAKANDGTRGKRVVVLVFILVAVVALAVANSSLISEDPVEEDSKFLVPKDKRQASNPSSTSSSPSTPSQLSVTPKTDSGFSFSWSFLGKQVLDVEAENWDDLVKQVAHAISKFDDKLLEAAMSSDVVQNIREKLGFDPLNKDGSLRNPPHLSNTPSSDQLSLTRAAIVSEALKDVSEYAAEEAEKKVEQAQHANSTSGSSSIPTSTSTSSNDKASTNQVSSPSATEGKGLILVETSSTSTPPPASTERIATSTQFNESYDTQQVEEEVAVAAVILDAIDPVVVPVTIPVSAVEKIPQEVVVASPIAAPVIVPVVVEAPQIPSQSQEEVLSLLSIENEEMRHVVIKLMIELELLKEKAEKAVAEATEGRSREIDLLRQDEAKRVMEILGAYEVKLANELSKVQTLAAEEKAALKQQFQSIVATTLVALRESYDARLTEHSRALEAFASKMTTDLLEGPVREVATRVTEDAHSRLALTLAIKESLQDTHAAMLQYHALAKDSAAYARVARQWIILQDRVSKFPGAPFYPQLQGYLNACKEVPQLSNIVDALNTGAAFTEAPQKALNSSLPSPSSPSSSGISSLVRISQLGSPTLNQLKIDFAEAAKAARTSTLAPEGANAFQHGLASLREAFRSSAPSAVSSIASTVEKGVEKGVSAVLDSGSNDSSSSSSSSSSSDPEDKNWSTLQKAETLLLQHDALGPALEALQSLDGPPALLMKPWMDRAQQTYFVSSTLDFFAFQTANLDFSAPSPPPASSVAPSTSSNPL